MASFRPHGKGIQAEVCMRGVRRAQTFESKGAARAWAHALEAEIMAGVRGDIPDFTLSELFDRYEHEVSKGKKGERWERVRLGTFKRDRIALVRLRQLDTPHVSDWQRRRLDEVSGATVRRERNLMNNVFEIARKEWKWLKKNPFEGVRRPKDGKHRDRIATPDELRTLLVQSSTRLGRAILVAVETGMRESEIASNPPILGRVATLSDTKNGTSREVPLSAEALGALNAGIGLTADSISQLFARLCGSCRIAGLTFHDLRHTAATYLAKKMDILDLCKMFGWKDPRMAMRYYKSNAEAIAATL